ncbi:MAG: sigma 54-interacting transcriptional regulator [Desulfitobacteriaceae bacterium]|nr:sigma 54-interacting transcriptional regulator [Desulfitobacteriaceae bacterium]
MFENHKIAEIFDQNPYMAVIILDINGIVLYVNETYLKAFRLPLERVLGRPIIAITPKTKTAKVLSTGKAVTAYNWNINGNQMIGCALPIFKEDEIVGCFAYSISLNIWDSRTMLERLLAENNMLKDEVYKTHTAKYTFDDIIGNNHNLLETKLLAQQVAHQADTKVLITGESGTGKELFAHAIHNASGRSQGPFVRVNCAAIPENLLEAELFGYEDGAFTGAKKGGRLGKFELANQGTIFLDEIGEMPLSMQSKLLVVLQEREIERLGGDRSIKLNVRVISATNRNLQDMIDKGTFREDLYYRLNVVGVEVPALRYRKKDIAMLAQYFLHKLNHRFMTPITSISREAINILEGYAWPGNIRELENVMERAMSLASMEKIEVLSKRYFTMLCPNPEFNCPLGNENLKAMTCEFEQNVLNRTLEKTSGNKVLAAEYLGIDLSSLYRKLKKHNIPIS